MTSSAGSTLTDAECWKVLRAGSVGRVAVIDQHSGIEIFPVNYVVEHGTIVFRTARGTKLSAVDNEPTVAFEVDGRSPEGVTTSVVALGQAEPITAHADLLDAFDIDLSTWVEASRPFFVRIVPFELRGSSPAIGAD
jgi:nitroimidazol reductase NimA-like FMN-containing flavoprotein (pyridoxamine 5'-phosphate oxidase superfamily)